jgi:hypothetical protein
MPPDPRAMQRAGHELRKRPPRILKHTARKFGKKRANKQRIAIMMSKARKGK